ncbi:RNA polymerase sigma factor [Planctomycetota bacterium]
MDRHTFAEFPQTSWTMIRQANNLSEEDRRIVVDRLIQQYWRPLYAYYRASGNSISDAEDAVQSLLLRFLTDDRFLAVSPDRGRFRNWLIACAKHHLLDRERHKKALKRSPVSPQISLDDLKTKVGDQFEPSTDESPDSAYFDAWRRELLDSAIKRVASICGELQREQDFEVFCEYYLSELDVRPTWKKLADKFELPSWKHAARKADYVKVLLGKTIRDAIRQYVEDEGEIDEELRSILG